MFERSSQFRLISVVLSTVISLVLIAGCGEKAEKAVPSVGEIQFITDYDQALATARQKDQSILIDFYTDWCKWCKHLDSVTYTDSTVIQMSNNIIFAKINAEVDTALVEQYSIQGYPTLVLTESDGNEIDRIGGFLPPDEFVETVNNYLQGIGTLDDYLRRADTNATTEVNFVLGEKYSDRGIYDKARSYYELVVEADPDNNDGYTSDAMLSLGSILLREKEYDQSIAQFEKVAGKFEGDTAAADAQLWIAYVYQKKGDTAGAIKTYEGFLTDFPNSEDTSVALRQIDKLKNPPPPEEESNQ
jgi:thioredoxin-like negative regulator of GroEL